ncbi:MAG: S-methyl-5-thioribose-1-phosphate isomerase [Clostridia bacterium]|nr:S-methyl-5-thioribose-1-phosphate isomerase [Clostridia bacterium]
MLKESGLPRTVTLDTEKAELVIIDQTLLPNELKLLRLIELDEMCDAIKKLRVRGAPAIGVAAAAGLYCLAERYDTKNEDEFFQKLKADADILNATRPTARNLSWALEEMISCAESHKGKGVVAVKSALKAKAKDVEEQDVAVCKAIGEHGAALLKDGDTVMTVCNAGALAAVEYGTALAPVYVASENGKKVAVYSMETRPLLQGARLTSFELTENGVDTTLICDNMAASVLAQGKINAIFTGCDRVAANGDAANKIGTYMLAILAKHFDVPFYVCAPYSTVDFSTKKGEDIIIEQRSGEELRSLWYEKSMVTKKARIYNPAFDVTPAELITAFITERGIKKPHEL